MAIDGGADMAQVRDIRTENALKAQRLAEKNAVVFNLLENTYNGLYEVEKSIDNDHTSELAGGPHEDIPEIQGYLLKNHKAQIESHIKDMASCSHRDIGSYKGKMKTWMTVFNTGTLRNSMTQVVKQQSGNEAIVISEEEVEQAIMMLPEMRKMLVGYMMKPYYDYYQTFSTFRTGLLQAKTEKEKNAFLKINKEIAIAFVSQNPYIDYYLRVGTVEDMLDESGGGLAWKTLFGNVTIFQKSSNGYIADAALLGEEVRDIKAGKVKIDSQDDLYLLRAGQYNDQQEDGSRAPTFGAVSGSLTAAQPTLPGITITGNYESFCATMTVEDLPIVPVSPDDLKADPNLPKIQKIPGKTIAAGNTGESAKKYDPKEAVKRKPIEQPGGVPATGGVVAGDLPVGGGQPEKPSLEENPDGGSGGNAGDQVGDGGSEAPIAGEIDVKTASDMMPYDHSNFFAFKKEVDKDMRKTRLQEIIAKNGKVVVMIGMKDRCVPCETTLANMQAVPGITMLYIKHDLPVNSEAMKVLEQHGFIGGGFPQAIVFKNGQKHGDVHAGGFTTDGVKKWYGITDKPTKLDPEAMPANNNVLQGRDGNITKLGFENIPGTDKLLHGEALKQSQLMFADMKKELSLSKDIRITSPYRSFKNQQELWNRKWNTDPRCKDINDPTTKARKILEFSQIPGLSRHHWGTEIDIENVNPGDWENGELARIYTWMEKNAYKYGYVQPYKGDRTQGGKTHAISEEKWHRSYAPIAGPLYQAQEKVLRDGTYNVQDTETLGHGVLTAGFALPYATNIDPSAKTWKGGDPERYYKNGEVVKPNNTAPEQEVVTAEVIKKRVETTYGYANVTEKSVKIEKIKTPLSNGSLKFVIVVKLPYTPGAAVSKNRTISGFFANKSAGGEATYLAIQQSVKSAGGEVFFETYDPKEGGTPKWTVYQWDPTGGSNSTGSTKQPIDNSRVDFSDLSGLKTNMINEFKTGKYGTVTWNWKK